MTELFSNSVQPLAYATPGAKIHRYGPAVWLAILGLVLIGIGGCFLIGVMGTLTDRYSYSGAPPAMTSGHILLLVVLYCAAFGCFGGATWLIVKGVKSLIKFLIIA